MKRCRGNKTPDGVRHGMGPHVLRYMPDAGNLHQAPLVDRPREPESPVRAGHVVAASPQDQHGDLDASHAFFRGV
ncbi:hypothetical protein D3C78_1929120 [compost metagenome]